jgi:hypothetical protein
MAAKVDDAIQAISLFQQLRERGMTTCNYVLLLPEQRISEQMMPLVERVQNATFVSEDYIPNDFSQHWQTALCPVKEWVEDQRTWSSAPSFQL